MQRDRHDLATEEEQQLHRANINWLPTMCQLHKIPVLEFTVRRGRRLRTNTENVCYLSASAKEKTLHEMWLVGDSFEILDSV